MKKNGVAKKLICDECGATSFKNRITTFPLHLLNGKILNVGRVAVKECSDCSRLIPTQKGKEKLARAIEAFCSLMT